ncbi:MAG: BCCT family transporter [Treponema sp.]|jgi:BCCT family betaine/carnitine transporter|nr:BCCT family transporter [Treponema sp.]
METKKTEIDFTKLFFPLVIVAAIAALIYFFPARAQAVIALLNDVFVNRLGFCYILIGVFMVGCSVWVAASRYGRIKLGNAEKPVYSSFKWGAMIFTSTMAADILYWSLIEWVYYYQANPAGAPSLSEAQHQLIASSYPLFHWGPIPWAFYILPAAAYAYMFFVKGRNRSSLSEACRPILRSKTDGPLGSLIDIVAIIGFIGGTATTFATATPLISEAINTIFGLALGKSLTIIILLIIGLVFTGAVLFGMKAIAHLAVFNVAAFALLLSWVFILGPSRFIIESGVSGVGNVLQNFIGMATWTDPLRLTGDGVTGFPQQWTIFYWAYWIAWFVATPFFIAKISEGRRLRQMISGAFFYGISGTFLSFIVFGNFGLYQQVTGRVDTVGLLAAGTAPAKIIVQFLGQLPLAPLVLLLLAVVMIAFYASTFDAITLVIAGFCKRGVFETKSRADTRLRVFWAAVLIILPLSLIWSESTLVMLQTVSIIAAFPVAIIMLIIVAGFLRELRGHPKE